MAYSLVIICGGSKQTKQDNESILQDSFMTVRETLICAVAIWKILAVSLENSVEIHTSGANFWR